MSSCPNCEKEKVDFLNKHHNSLVLENAALKAENAKPLKLREAERKVIEAVKTCMPVRETFGYRLTTYIEKFERVEKALAELDAIEKEE